MWGLSQGGNRVGGTLNQLGVQGATMAPSVDQSLSVNLIPRLNIYDTLKCRWVGLTVF